MAVKFGKSLARVIEYSDPEWTPYWVNYKLLKKLIKQLPRAPAPGAGSTANEGANASAIAAMEAHAADAAAASQEQDPSPPPPPETAAPAPLLPQGPPPESPSEQITALSRSVEETGFFRVLLKELNKCSQFFRNVEAQFLVRLGHVRAGMQMVDMDSLMTRNEDPWRHMMAACVKFYKDLLRLENYAIITYCAFSKIIKKHDKWTGFSTRKRFMQNMVNKEPFTHFPRTVEMLEEVEGMYQRIQACRSQFTNSRLHEEEMLFIETIRGINREVSRLQVEEHRENNAGDPPAKRRRGGGDIGQQHDPNPEMAMASSSSGSGWEGVAEDGGGKVSGSDLGSGGGGSNI